MPIGNGRKPSVFVSSTCYDLSQVRTDIKLFIEGLGYEPILSEYDSFPIDPNINTLDNCLRVVQERADIFVLIVGGRYGSQINNDKSITNMEYLRAKAKGIPIYVFVNKSVLDILKIWRSNPDGDFSSVVDSHKLFEFVETLRGIDNVWVYGFDNAQDINYTLKQQFAYLFNDGLLIRRQIKNSNFSNKILQLKGEAFRLVIEKPEAWEYKLFAQVFSDGIEESTDLRRDLKYNISINESKLLSEVKDIISWIQIKINDLLTLSEGLGSLINNVMQEAVGLPGEPGDAEHIVYAAEKIVQIYKKAIIWAIDFKTIVVTEEDWLELIKTVTEFGNNIIIDLEDYCDKWNRELKKLTEQEDPVELDLTFKLRAPDLSKYSNEIMRLKAKYGID